MAELKREIHSIIQPLERPLISWIIKHYPAWITPDLLTYTSLASGPAMLAAYYFSQFNHALIWLASFFLFINWLTDSTDGGLARYRQRQRPNYGHYTDHAFDMIVTMCIGLGLGFSPVLHMVPSIALVFLFYLWTLHSSISSSVIKTYRLTYFKIGPTELRLLVLIGQTFWLFYPNATIAGSHVVELAARTVLGIGIALLFYESIKTIISLRTKDESRLPKQ